MTSPSKRALKNFYTLLFSGKFSKAERALERIKKRYKLGDDDGYYRALYGIYYAYSTEDRNSFLFELWRRYLEGESIRSLRRSFREALKKIYEPPADFIQAWLDLIGMLGELPTPHKLKPSEVKKQEEL